MHVLDAEESAIVDTVRDFVDRDVRPVARELEHANTYPEKLIDQMKELGDLRPGDPRAVRRRAACRRPCYALVTEELARGWMSLAGAMGGHTVVAKLLLDYGTEEQQRRYLPRMATGELRATMALTEPGGGSDLQAMRTVAAPRRRRVRHQRREDLDHQRPPRRADRAAVQDRPDGAARAHGHQHPAGREGPGLHRLRGTCPKLGYKGVESCELHLRRLPRARQPRCSAARRATASRR